MLGSLVTPLSKFKYPIEKRRTADNVETLRAAEKNLDAFWLKVDRELLDKNGIPQRERLVHILPYGELQRTPKWIAATEVIRTVSFPPDSATALKMLLIELSRVLVSAFESRILFS